MIEEYREFEQILSSIMTSAAAIGAAGGLIKAYNHKMNFKQTLGQVLSGAIIAQVCSPHIYEHCPTDVQPVAIFICGYGGIELVNFVFEVGKDFLSKKFNISFDKVNSKLKAENNETSGNKEDNKEDKKEEEPKEEETLTEQTTNYTENNTDESFNNETIGSPVSIGLETWYKVK